jgi:hypothetical protein
MARASVDLPAALGPITATTAPALTAKVILLSVIVWVPGTATAKPSMLSPLVGGCSSNGLLRLGRLANIASRR